jgi:hypothetical protein
MQGLVLGSRGGAADPGADGCAEYSRYADWPAQCWSRRPINAYAHLTSADVEALGSELDTIGHSVKQSLGERDAQYTS